jgi:hypothetical protein
MLTAIASSCTLLHRNPLAWEQKSRVRLLWKWRFTFRAISLKHHRGRIFRGTYWNKWPLGKREAITLAQELRAALVLMNDTHGREEVQQRALTATGPWASWNTRPSEA